MYSHLADLPSTAAEFRDQEASSHYVFCRQRDREPRNSRGPEAIYILCVPNEGLLVRVGEKSGVQICIPGN